MCLAVLVQGTGLRRSSRRYLRREQGGTLWPGSVGNRDQSWKRSLWMAQKFISMYCWKSLEVDSEKGEECR